MAEQETAAFDVYAKPYVPQKWKTINSTPVKVSFCTPPPSINTEIYARSFSGDWLLDHASQDASHSRANAIAARRGSSRDVLDNTSYGPFFFDALSKETHALQIESEDQALYMVPLPVINGYHMLSVPGLREASLRIEVGDIVHVRPFRRDVNGHPILNLLTNPTGSAATFNYGKRYDASVWAIDRAHETVSLRIDAFFAPDFVFNICFTTQTSRLEALHQAVHAASTVLQSFSNTWLCSMLFPEHEHGVMQTDLNPIFTSLELDDVNLNHEQTRAVQAVIDHNYGQVPYLIHGPPGTGKTKTVVELTLQMVKEAATARILLCAPSDPAADTLIQRLANHLSPQEMVRINAPSRSFPEVPGSVLPFCYVQDNIFNLPPFSNFMKKKVVVVTCRDVNLLQKTRLSNKDLFELEQRLHACLHPESGSITPALHWTGVVIDEAAQATEPEALLPILLVAPPNVPYEDFTPPRVVLVGDQNQLGPRTASKHEAIRTSLFERLLARPFYKEHPLARSQNTTGTVRPLTRDMLPIRRPAFTDLIRNYRSHPAILATPGSLFYNDTLEPCAKYTDSLLKWSGFRDNKMPVLFADCRSNDEIERDGGGWYNLPEADLALSLGRSFLISGLLKAHEICIMSPFRAQVRVLRMRARQPTYNMWNVNIGPLEAFQGLESRLVILCTTRTRNRFVDQDMAKGIGVIHEPRRFNVALTRAKEGLIVIGNPHVLDQDENWASFIAFCKRNNADRGWRTEHIDDWDTPHSSKIRTSRLEKQLAYRTTVNGQSGGTARRLGNLQLGMTAEEALYESGVAAEEAFGGSGDKGDDEERELSEDEAIGGSERLYAT